MRWRWSPAGGWTARCCTSPWTSPGPQGLWHGLFSAPERRCFFWTLWTFFRHRTTVNPYKGASALCTGGPFRFSRNPIYVGDWCFLLGAAVWLRTAWPLVFAPLIWASLRYAVIRHEEAHLEARFGEEYRRYKARVRRWL